MLTKTYHPTHLAMMDGASNDDLRDRYLVANLFVPGELVLTYSHDERFIIGGAVPRGGDALALPRQSEPPSAAGHPLLQRREMGMVNVGGAEECVIVDGEAVPLTKYQVLYVPRGSAEVAFKGEGARFFLLSVPAQATLPRRQLTLGDGNALHQGSLETADDRTIHQLLVPEVCETASLCLGLTRLKPGSVWNTMPPPLHDRRSEHTSTSTWKATTASSASWGSRTGCGRSSSRTRRRSSASPWSVHMGVGTSNYAFIWAMAGENLDDGHMDVCDMAQPR